MEVLRASSTCLVCAGPVDGREVAYWAPVPVTLNLHEDGRTWLAHSTDPGCASRVTGAAHRGCFRRLSTRLYGQALA
jgi:hypothetical protein